LCQRNTLFLFFVLLKAFQPQVLGNKLNEISISHSLEPVGFKAPVFSSESKISLFEKPMNANIALFCQAQAYPVPMIR
jgi:hypothetical protein